MPDHPKEIETTLRAVLQLLASAMIETHSLHLALLRAEVLTPAMMNEARKPMQEKWQKILDILAEPTPVDFEKILRSFEGPLQ
jgi:hypothetical protein